MFPKTVLYDILSNMSTPDGTTGCGINVQEWVYSDIVKDHFFNPRNFFSGTEPESYSGVGIVGSPACGDIMKLWITVDDTDRITDAKWQTFGCASAISATSMLSVMLTENEGMTVEDALKLKPKDIMDRLGGLPIKKVHCSVLGDKALHMAIDDYQKKKQLNN